MLINNWLYIARVTQAADKRIYNDTTINYSQTWSVVITDVYMVLTGMCRMADGSTSTTRS